MAGDSTFDVVSDFDQQELVNALDQARREIATRYDFKGSKVAFELGKDAITLTADDEYRAGAAKDLLETKAVRRGLSLKIFEWGTLEPAVGRHRAPGDQAEARAHQRTGQGAREAHSRGVSRRRSRSIQGDAVRVSAKSRDELQAVIADLRALDYPVALQFTNYR